MDTTNFLFREMVALDAAKWAHGDQTRKYTGEPYWKHTERVAQTVKATPGATVEMVEASYLHDVLEDTDVSETTLRMLFSPTTVSYVVWLTDPPKDVGNRAKRKAMTIERLARAPAAVKTIKLADILDNIPSTLKHDPTFGKIMLREKAMLLPSLKGGDPGLYAKVAKLLGVQSTAHHT